MDSHRSRLDRFISRQIRVKRRDVRALLAQGRVTVDGRVATDIALVINQFSAVVVDEQCLPVHRPLYIMLNKPVGVVSATKDTRHTTVIDLLRRADRDQLHIPGRLDINSTGLLLLTNNGQWSRQLSLPERQIAKVYTVTVAEPLSEEYVNAFAAGMYFDYENITTRPAELKIVSDHIAEVTLCEGRYHQIKRMFGRFQNEVLSLHRHRVGSLNLDAALAPGEYRDLSRSEVAALAES